ncbi:hypothetical protein C8J57DRAFT_1101243 [Mycena rebaudengoi]|nr:hypothetical protein C8J57DRAFT_1101243 [Mycena rebaudengoi]
MDIAGTLFADPIVAVLKTSDPDDNEDPDDANHFDDSPLQESDTIWADDYIKSFVQVGTFRITPKVTVRRQEYITEIPSAWPVFRETTAIHLDLSNPKFNIKNKLTTELHSPDYLIYNKDNDSYRGNTGSGDNSGMVVMSPGEPPVKCRRARRTCAGTVACENLDCALIEVERYELDPTSRNAIFAAQQNTKKCEALDSNGITCTGGPTLKPKPQVFPLLSLVILLSIGSGRRTRTYIFCSCSGWSRKFQNDHRTLTIRDNVDENLLAKLFAGQPLATDTDKDTEPCSRVVPRSTGLKLKYCPHTHITDGRSDTRSQMVHHECYAARTVYVPIDKSIRKALVIIKNIPHSHPMPVFSKVSEELKHIYVDCVTAVGSVDATVSKVDNANSTKLLLNGKTYAPALHSKRVKRDLVRGVKSTEYPAGLGVDGAFHLFREGLTKPLPERYIHGFITNPDGSICIVTCVPFLLKLMDDPGVGSFEDDTTFKRVKGEMNEWELALFVSYVQRAATVVRAYINKASADFFELLFDEVQHVKLQVTGKPIPLKKFVPGGNLIAMNADMEAAQVIGACRSVMKHNDPAYSGVRNDAPVSEVAPHFVKICFRHSKAAVLDFKPLVSPTDHRRLLDFMYIDSKEKLDEFSVFVKGLGIKNFTDWWAHKEMSDWIIPCLVKSQSFMSADDWDNTPSTTNTGEAQHHWTNSITGIGLSLVEAIEKVHSNSYFCSSISFLTLCSARKVDQDVARDIEASMKSGILTNPHNDVFHRTGRNNQRQTAAAHKSRESQQLTEQSGHLRDEIDAEKERRRQSTAAKDPSRAAQCNEGHLQQSLESSRRCYSNC